MIAEWYEVMGLWDYLHYLFARPKRNRTPHDKWIASKEFLKSYDWADIRYQALKKYGGCCKACAIRAGMIGDDGKPAVIHVDHIKCRKKYPQLALNISNLQPLCHLCNWGKGNKDRTNWRKI
jgi:5-methylcytosine-specific restriction endonuclease McrA